MSNGLTQVLLTGIRALYAAEPPWMRVLHERHRCDGVEMHDLLVEPTLYAKVTVDLRGQVEHGFFRRIQHSLFPYEVNGCAWGEEDFLPNDVYYLRDRNGDGQVDWATWCEEWTISSTAVVPDIAMDKFHSAAAAWKKSAAAITSGAMQPGGAGRIPACYVPKGQYVTYALGATPANPNGFATLVLAANDIEKRCTSTSCVMSAYVYADSPYGQVQFFVYPGNVPGEEELFRRGSVK